VLLIHIDPTFRPISVVIVYVGTIVLYDYYLLIILYRRRPRAGDMKRAECASRYPGPCGPWACIVRFLACFFFRLFLECVGNWLAGSCPNDAYVEELVSTKTILTFK